MLPERWNKIESIFNDALARTRDRAEFLDSACEGDESLRHEVDLLVQGASEEQTNLDLPALGWAIGDEDKARAVWRAASNAVLALNGSEPNAKDRCCGAYRLLRLIGNGGMGSVYLAERVDGEVQQRVAIKLLRFGAEDRAAHSRFLRERQILATLEHPGIARLLDAGHTDDGQPYLVMEYIEGQAVDVYAESLPLRAKLQLFLEVCDAVSYAHRNLVVHRDIKPANILVDGRGQTKLLDFGIAKILDDVAKDTQTADRLLTPHYASPEQLLGSARTTATDIYSLGAVLYKLLTGSSPHIFTGEGKEEIVQAIVTRTPIAPSHFNRALPRDLDAILAKALRKEPGERYQSVDAFADDIQSLLDWRPVRARSGNAWYRVRRFTRRYRAAVSAVALTIVGLSTGLCMANHERQVAQHRFAQVRQLAKQFIGLDDELKELPGSTKIRGRIVSESLQYLDTLGKDARGDRDLSFEIGYAYLQVARVQGVPSRANLGQVKEAEESLRNADRFIDSLLAVEPGDRRALLTSAEIAQDRMTLLDVQERRDEALIQAGRAMARLELLYKVPSHDPEETYNAARILSNAGVVFENSYHFDAAIRCCRRALEVSRLSPAAGARQGSILGVMSLALRGSGDLNGALAAVQESRRLLDRAPQNSGSANRLNLMIALMREGLILGPDQDVGLGRVSDALAVFRTGLKLAEDLAGKDPSDELSAALVARFARETGDILRHTDPQTALTIYDRGLARIRQTKPSERAQFEEAALLADSSYAVQSLRRTRDAKQRIDAAFRILRNLKQYPTDKLEPMGECDHALTALADYYVDTGDPKKAHDTYEEELTGLLAWRPTPSDDLQTANSFSRNYAGLSRILGAMGRKDEAQAFETRRAALWQHWNTKLPNNPFVLRQIAASDSRN